ncbi:MAG: acyltransferase [Phycisphaerae bacterium]|nr:acyltransferase [Phycisphaerae bacterium]
MPDGYPDRFASCGGDVKIAEDVFIEHPEVMEIGDRVTFMRGVYIMGRPKRFAIGDDVTFYPNVFHQGSPGRVTIGNDVQFFPNCYLSSGDWDTSFIEVGDHTHFAPGCILYGWGGLKVGSYNAIAAGCMLSTVSQFTDKTERPMVTYGENADPITLEDDVYLGASVVVNQGVTVRRGCVVGANSVVLEDTEEYGFYVGVPARLRRKRR